MRILIINSEYPPIGGGAGNASANLSRELAVMGHEVSILTSCFANLPSEERHGDVRLLRIRAIRKRHDRSTALEQITFMISSCYATLRLVPKWKPDVVLVFFGVPSGPAALLANIFYKVPYVVSMRGGDVPGFRPYDFAFYHKLIAPFLRVIWRRAAVLVANSSGLKNLARKFDSDVRIEIIPNGVDLELYETSQRQWEPVHLLLVGRLVYQKGIDLLLEALATLKHLTWSLSLVGDGPEWKSLQSMATMYEISDRVRFENWLTGDDLLKQYSLANLFVLPSRHEGMPNAILEAMACGLPVVASCIAGNEELVSSGETGLLVPPEDVPSLKNALEELIIDANQRKEMGEAGRTYVEKNYAWDHIANKYLELIQNIVDDS